jgi:hypothetical protein
VPDLARIKIFEDLAAPRRLRASSAIEEVRLDWEGDLQADGYELWRGFGGEGEIIAELAAGSIQFIDSGLPRNSRATYVLRGKKGADTGPGIAVALTAAREFRRGDVDENGERDITDAIVTLEYLFLGRGEPACLDTGDFDDSGAVEITDVILLLAYLFITGSPPEPPFPAPGLDPTFDSLPCR